MKLTYPDISCKGTRLANHKPNPMQYTNAQREWMLENKPLLYTGNLFVDIAHLPANLRKL